MYKDKLTAALDGWLAVRQAEGLKETTLTNYRTFISIFISWLGNKELTPVSFADFFRDYRRDHAVASQQAIYVALKIFLSGIGEGKKMGSMGRPRGETPPKDTYTQEQLVALFKLLRANKTATGLRDYAVCSILRYTGIRAGEVCGLQLEDLDTQAETLTITSGKTRYARRTIPLVEPCSKLLFTYLSRGRPKLVHRAFNHLFLSAAGRPMNRNSLALILGRKDVPFKVGVHRFRHTFITRHATASTNPALIGQLAGWSSHTLSAMLANYTHPSGEDLREAQKKALGV